MSFLRLTPLVRSLHPRPQSFRIITPVRFFSPFDKDPYDVLGVSRSADEAEIKAKYRSLAKKFHPDVNKAPDAKEKFAEINNAYEILSSPDKRKSYDTFGSADEQHMNRGPFQAGGFNAEEIFGEFFGGNRKRRQAGASMAGGPIPGNDVQVTVRVSFMEAVHGTQRDVTVNSKASCSTCNGSGAKPGTSAKTCPECRGTGRVVFQSGFFTFENTCGRCGGSGQIISTPCVTCSGSGRVEQSKVITVTVPPGVDTGVNLRVPGKGDAGVRGGPGGHLYVEVVVEKDPFFRREGFDVHTDVSLSLVEALLGGSVTIPTLTGEVELKIPEGVQHGDERVLRAKGIKRLNEAGFGNHYVHFHIEMPRSLNAKQREALQEFAKASGEEKVCDRRENIFKQTLNKVKSFMESRNKAKEKAADAEKSKDDSKKD